MSIEQTRRSLNQCDQELVILEKKLAEQIKKEADTNKKIYDVQKNITKNTSIGSLQSKQKQIDSYQKDLISITRKKAEINNNIASKKKLRVDRMLRLQKEEADEQKNIQKKYEKRISDLSAQLIQHANISSFKNHLYSEQSDEEYDVFISHASEDKEFFADEFKKELVERGVKVWYDNTSIAWGDSLRVKIDEGLKKSKYGIVVLSNDYIRKGWTQYELDGLFNIEMNSGKTILPIWHRITKKEVQDFSPTLAGRKALSSALMTPAEIAEELVKLLGINEEDNIYEQSKNAQPK